MNFGLQALVEGIDKTKARKTAIILLAGPGMATSQLPTWPLSRKNRGDDEHLLAAFCEYLGINEASYAGRPSALARTLIAAPAVIAAVVAFCASMLALLPEYRRPALRVAAIVGWVIAAWLVMAAMILAGIKFATEQLAA
jgi:hypothetical protein